MGHLLPIIVLDDPVTGQHAVADGHPLGCQVVVADDGIYLVEAQNMKSVLFTGPGRFDGIPPAPTCLLYTSSPLALAFVGDGVYELMVRERLVREANRPAGVLHKRTVELVRAEAQAAAMERLLPLLTEEEAAAYRRGRNAHTARTGGDYHKATGLEALFLSLIHIFHRLSIKGPLVST